MRGAALLRVLQPIDDRTAAFLEASLQAGEALVDAPPAGRDQIHEECEIVHAGMALRERVALDPLEPPDRAAREPADLGELPGDRKRLGAEPLLNGLADPTR